VYRCEQSIELRYALLASSLRACRMPVGSATGSLPNQLKLDLPRNCVAFNTLSIASM